MLKKPRDLNVNLGSGVRLLKDFINIDSQFSLYEITAGIGKKGTFENAEIQEGAGFIQADMRKLPFKTNTVDYIECLAALEHVPFRDVPLAVKEMYRVLKPGKKSVVLVPDFDDIARMWMDYIQYAEGKQLSDYSMDDFRKMTEAIYGNQVSEGEFHRSAFNPYYTHILFTSAGFKDPIITVYTRQSHPPKFKGTKWPEDSYMSTGMILIEAVK